MKVFWATAFIFGIVTSAAPPTLPNKLNDDAPINESTTADQRALRVKDAFKFAYNAYEARAFGHDETQSVSGKPSDSRNGWGATIFDALDTMKIMKLEEEYDRALAHVAKVKWNVSNDKSKTFETNIRYLGGLLGAYDLSPNKILLDQAVALTEQVILPSFYTDNQMPLEYVDVTSGKPDGGSENILAEFGSLQLELVRLSQLTGNQTYADYGLGVIERISKVAGTFPGLYPMTWNMNTMEPMNEYITVSGGADSFYEYLLKTHILIGDKDELQLKMWTTAVNSMKEHLRSRTLGGKVFLAAFNGKTKKMLETGELICFLPGNILMGSKLLKNQEYESFASELMDGCSHAWEAIPSGLAPESWNWADETQNVTNLPPQMQMSMKTYGIIPQSVYYDLRPETLESLFYFYRITGDPSYQDKAWAIFMAIEKYCKVKYGYARIKDVTVSNPNDAAHDDFQESFLFAETFKYLYLIFSDPKLISLDEYVFNTEAHPLKLASPVKIQKN